MKSRLLLSIFLSACFTVNATVCSRHSEAPPLLKDSTHKTYLALGDSYTIGQSVGTSERFPAQAVQWLAAKGISIQQPQYIATTGWTTLDLQNGISSTDLLKSYDLVTLLIGVNDQFQGLDTSGYRRRFMQLLEKSISLSNNKRSHVFVLSIPDYGVTPFGGGDTGISKAIDAFNAINKEITLAHRVAYIDITPLSRVKEATLTASDGLHPSAKQYRQWVGLLAPLMLQALQ